MPRCCSRPDVFLQMMKSLKLTKENTPMHVLVAFLVSDQWKRQCPSTWYGGRKEEREPREQVRDVRARANPHLAERVVRVTS
jgi:hypothetical protein